MILDAKFKVVDNTIDIHAQAPNLQLKEGTLILVQNEGRTDLYCRKIHTKADYDHYVEANQAIAKEYGADLYANKDLDKVPANAWVGFLEEDNHKIHIPLKIGQVRIYFRSEDIQGQEDRDKDRMAKMIEREILYAMRWVIEQGSSACDHKKIENEAKERAKSLTNHLFKEVWIP
jgi:hypothetical protein